MKSYIFTIPLDDKVHHPEVIEGAVLVTAKSIDDAYLEFTNEYGITVAKPAAVLLSVLQVKYPSRLKRWLYKLKGGV